MNALVLTVPACQQYAAARLQAWVPSGRYASWIRTSSWSDAPWVRLDSRPHGRTVLMWMSLFSQIPPSNATSSMIGRIEIQKKSRLDRGRSRFQTSWCITKTMRGNCGTRASCIISAILANAYYQTDNRIALVNESHVYT